MAFYWRVLLVCSECKKKSMPARKSQVAILKVLTGGITKCPKCGAEFSFIIVNPRPLVRTLMKKVTMSSSVLIPEDGNTFFENDEAGCWANIEAIKYHIRSLNSGEFRPFAIIV